MGQHRSLTFLSPSSVDPPTSRSGFIAKERVSARLPHRKFLFQKVFALPENQDHTAEIPTHPILSVSSLVFFSSLQ